METMDTSPYVMYLLTVVSAFITAFLLTRPSDHFVRNFKKNPYSWRKADKKKGKKGEKGEEEPVWASGLSPTEFVVRPRGEREGERLYDLFAYASEEFEESEIGWRKQQQNENENPSYEWETYPDYLTNIHKIGRGLRKLGVESGCSIGICDKNTHTSLTTLLACSGHNVVVVGVNAKWGEEEIQSVLNERKVVGLQVGWEEWQRVKGVLGGVNTLKVVVVSGWEGGKGEGEKLGKGVQVIGWEELKKTGEKLEEEDFPLPSPPPTNSPSFISYTLGTTGPPKGFVHTHANLASSIASFDLLFDVESHDSYLSFLSFHHVFSVGMVMCCLGKGMKVGLCKGGKGLDSSDLKEIRPTFLPIDTFLATEIRKQIEKTLSSANGFTKALFRRACASRLSSIQQREQGYSSWTNLMFRETKRIFGGQIRLFVSYSPSPLSSSLHQFLRIFFGASVCQVYGLTESCSVASGMLYDDFSTGRCGGVLPSSLLRLQDVPKMGFKITDKPNPRGEILLSGLNITQQEEQQKQKSNKGKVPKKDNEEKETISKINTGDIGEIFADGTLKILGRKEQMVKDPHSGAYFSLELLETTYTQSAFVDYLAVSCGKNGVFAIISPNFGYILNWAKENNIKQNEKQLLKNEKLRDIILEDLKSYAEKSKFEGYQTIKNIYLVQDRWKEEEEKKREERAKGGKGGKGKGGKEEKEEGCVVERGLCGGWGVNSSVVLARYSHLLS